MRFFTTVLILLVELSLAGCAPEGSTHKKVAETVTSPLPPPVSREAAVKSMSVWQARKTVFAALQHIVAGDMMPSQPTAVKLNGSTLEFYASLVGEYPGCYVGVVEGQVYHISLKTDRTFSVGPPPGGIASWYTKYGVNSVLYINGDLPFYKRGAFWEQCAPDVEGRIFGWLVWSSAEQTKSFADAMNRLIALARGEDAAGRDDAVGAFHAQASVWRALATKPSLSEEVLQHRLMAETAVREKDFDTAMEEYEAGLVANPVWPEGHFNAALLTAEMGYFNEAVRHMQAYVELLPNAPDAAAARDQILIWQRKAGG